MKLAQRALGSRSGFTLVELLVVVAIIGVLVALTVGAVTKFIGSQEEGNSKITVQKVERMLRQQWSAALDDANQHLPQDPNDPLFIALMNMARGDGGDDLDRAKVIWRKLWLKKEFPTSFAEATTPIVVGAPFNFVVANRGQYKKVLDRRDASKTKAGTESAACLLLALSVGRRGHLLDQETLGTLSAADTDGDGIKEIVDGWKQPVGFFRYPIEPELDASRPSDRAIFGDPLDPTGRLVDPKWNNFTNYSKKLGVWWFEQLCHPVHRPYPGPYTSASQPYSFYTVPVVVSAGPNKNLGLNLLDMSVTDQNAANDNIYSYRLR